MLNPYIVCKYMYPICSDFDIESIAKPNLELSDLVRGSEFIYFTCLERVRIDSRNLSHIQYSKVLLYPA